MTSPDKQVGITFNGEIYGYRDLKAAYREYRFRTQSDTELILAAYQRHGMNVTSHLPGMFGFALWDQDKQELLCARDRFGEKPLYYAIGRDGAFVFASEIKAILASGLVVPEIDRASMARYLMRQCVAVDQSIYANIRSLPPAHVLRYARGRIRISRYWTLPQVENDIAPGEAVGQLTSLLHQAVERQLVADVPLGAFLSGGLDSATVCSVASGLVDGLRTFTVDFEGGHSEAAYALDAARTYHTRHLTLSTGRIDLAEHVRLMQRVYDEPFGDPSAIPTYLLAREARRHVKVVLTGDGGDELFGGYTWYKPLMWMLREGRVGMLRWTAERLANRAKGLAKLPGALARELRIMGLAYGRQFDSVLDAHRAHLALFSRDDLGRLGVTLPAESLRNRDSARSDTIDDVLAFDVQDYMPADILTKIDRASMAHGLELRAPFLDVEFASFCLSLPYRMKLSTTEDKIILRDAFAAKWPHSIRERGKQGFGPPLERWFEDEGILDLERSALLNPRAPLFEMISFDGVREVLREGNVMKRWTLFVLGVWMEHIRGSSSGGSNESKPLRSMDPSLVST